MHKFYLTNNLGGGGTNVSRFVVYKDLFQTENIGVLFNYYYLNTAIKKTSPFDQDVLKNYRSFNDIEVFLKHIKKHFVEKGRITSEFDLKKMQSGLNSFLLDSGAGNIVRDLIKTDKLNEKNVDALISPFHEYAEKLNFDIVIALDYALKYTYKKGERKDEFLKQVWGDLAQNEEKNLLLLDRTLKHIKGKKINHKIYAPLHGFNFESFDTYLDGVLKLEVKHKLKFDGFALGGIASTRELKDEIWNVPEGFNKNQKTAWLVSELTKQTRKKIGSNPLHILGAANIYALPFITHYGGTSSDCHSAWRRSSDGEAKVLIPLLNNDLDFINDKNVFSYVKLGSIKEKSYDLNLPDGLTLKDLKKLYSSKNNEDVYFAKIFIFQMAIQQYDNLIKFMNKNPKDYLIKLTKTLDKKLNEEYLQVIDALK
jgi:hypothetical protein